MDERRDKVLYTHFEDEKTSFGNVGFNEHMYLWKILL